MNTRNTRAEKQTRVSTRNARRVLDLNWLAVLAAIFLLTVAGCASGSAAGPGSTPDSEEPLTVFAAASLTEAFQDIGSAFESEHQGRYTVALNFDGSQRLRTQLEHGARADVFASADQRQMDLAQEADLLSGEPVTFASNRLVVIAPSPAGTGTGGEGTDPQARVQRLEDLAGEGVRLVLALPEVPAGGYARAVIDNIEASGEFGPDYARRVLANLVSQETNVRNVVQKVALGEADAGIVYETDVAAEQAAQTVAVIPVPDRFNVVAAYYIAALRESSRPELAQSFVQFVQSAQGQQILRDHGFGGPP